MMMKMTICEAVVVDDARCISSPCNTTHCISNVIEKRQQNFPCSRYRYYHSSFPAGLSNFAHSTCYEECCVVAVVVLVCAACLCKVPHVFVCTQLTFVVCIQERFCCMQETTHNIYQRSGFYVMDRAYVSQIIQNFSKHSKIDLAVRKGVEAQRQWYHT